MFYLDILVSYGNIKIITPINTPINTLSPTKLLVLYDRIKTINKNVIV